MGWIIPSAGTPILFQDLVQAFLAVLDGSRAVQKFETFFQEYLGQRYCFLVNSGTTAFYVILKALKRFSNRGDVLLPAYTAPSLILPINATGLKPRLVDVSLETFNLDVEKTGLLLSWETLCLLPVHMFGMPCAMDELVDVSKNEGAFVVDDAASSMGAVLNGQLTGTLGNVGFYSFNRGKNLSTLSGGLICTDDPELALAIEEEREKLDAPNGLSKLGIAAKVIGLALAVRPWFYTLFKPVISGFKYTALHPDFAAHQYTGLQAALGLAIFQRAEQIFKVRTSNGLFLYRHLAGRKGLVLPKILPRSKPAFNQFPIIIEDEQKRDLILNEIVASGVEATVLYPYPIHEVYDLGYDLTEDPFPNATYLSRHLLLIPTHPIMRRDDLEKVVQVFDQHFPKMN
ncbi:DegT/DnrJ/EryC1/StrS family aminotransferase [candidate division KSB1 bacterium]|nr:DegT/DnrJ/EryC1/StrS family aminotransferase [candidate division KSB1 bacterium]